MKASSACADEAHLFGRSLKVQNNLINKIKKFWKYFKIVLIFIYLLAAFFSVVYVLFIILLLLLGNEFENTRLVNFVTLAVALLSIPNIFLTMVDLVKVKEKKRKKILLEGQCPKCLSKVKYYYEENEMSN